ISVIFRVRSAKAVKITDAALLKRLGCICGAIGTCLLVRTLVSPPDVVVGRTADDLKAFLCKTDWWDYTFTSMEVVFLAWGVRLCIMVRKAPSEFNESRFISMAIYNEFLLTCFLNVSMLFLQSPANPDLLYIIFFCHTQLTITLLLALIFGSKVYIVLRSGKSHQENIGMGAKSSGAKFNFRPQVRTFANPSSVTTSTAPVVATTSAENKLSDQEALEEIRQLSVQLQRIQEMAPPKGVAVMTISSLLDGLKTPGSMVMVAAAASQAVSGGGNQLTVRPNKPEALPLLSLNSEMQKYAQMQQQQQQKTNNNVVQQAVVPSTKITMATPSVTTASPKDVQVVVTATATTTAPIISEKAINTELSGNCVAEEELKQQHIICERCYERCRLDGHPRQGSSTLSKCQLLGSPPHEGSLTFKDIKLECMCSQSDDLDQLPTRRVAKRTAATNTPPPAGGYRGTRKPSTRHHRHKDAKMLSSSSLPCEDSSSATTTTTTKNQSGKASSTSTTTTSKQHRKLSRLSSKCSKLLSDIEKSQQISKSATGAAITSQRPSETGETSSIQKQYSTDDIIFYTTTDTSTSEDDDDDDEDEDEEDDYGEENDEDDDDGNVLHPEDDLAGELPSKLFADDSSSLSQSKSESKVATNNQGRNEEELPTTEDFKIISQSLFNITTSSSSSPKRTATAVTSAGNPNNALLDAKTSRATTGTAASSSNTTQQPTATTTANGNGKTKRPDKLVLNLNDRSKFTKEVSV
ncbi:uncharacterized protein LOC133330007, partial [Musca vetustissima]|uniref:uncharacterized protein LOC133330007 n=1 Tax=Musca vetustissima TaxID=27455 RepID=UPI002AB68B13